MLLKIGSKGSDVAKLQEALKLTADGSFGPKTEAAVKTFQAQAGLPATGEVDDTTWSKLPFAKPITMNLTQLLAKLPASLAPQLSDIITRFEINTPLRLAHFLAQCSHESGNFKVIYENLNYSSGRLNQVFPAYFKNKNVNEYGGKPEKIANLVYGNRMGNGPETSGEGYKFRGRGYIQLTGKDNYTAFGKAIGVDVVSDPDLVATAYPLVSAAWFFSKNKLLPIADGGSTPDVVEKVTRRVNGGTLGLADRIKHFNEYYALLR